jgi:ribose-phosphate pyrophosphokinase
MSFKTLNLANPSDSDIRFKISKFPDGQQSVTIEEPHSFIQGNDIKLYSRFSSFKDLELIICANQALREMSAFTIHLYAPYFMGARSDRKFTEGTSNYLKTVICPIINSQKFNSVLVLDPHSDVLEACLDNFVKTDNISIVKHSLTKIDNTNTARENLYLVSPDAGAMKKIYDVAEHFGTDKIVTAVKHRDVRTGKITHTEVPGLPETSGSLNFVIIDDICDGGRTFIELAKAIRERRPTSVHGDKIYLIVTHGIFSAGLELLSSTFDGIFTTNSVKDIVHDMEDTDAERSAKLSVTQFNVF